MPETTLFTQGIEYFAVGFSAPFLQKCNFDRRCSYSGLSRRFYSSPPTSSQTNNNSQIFGVNLRNLLFLFVVIAVTFINPSLSVEMVVFLYFNTALLVLPINLLFISAFLIATQYFLFNMVNGVFVKQEVFPKSFKLNFFVFITIVLSVYLFLVLFFALHQEIWSNDFSLWLYLYYTLLAVQAVSLGVSLYLYKLSESSWLSQNISPHPLTKKLLWFLLFSLFFIGCWASYYYYFILQIHSEVSTLVGPQSAFFINCRWAPRITAAYCCWKDYVK